MLKDRVEFLPPRLKNNSGADSPNSSLSINMGAKVKTFLPLEGQRSHVKVKGHMSSDDPLCSVLLLQVVRSQVCD